MRYSDFNEVKEVYCKLEERGLFHGMKIRKSVKKNIINF